MKANKLVLMLCTTMAMGLVFAGCTSNLDSAGDISGAEVDLGTDELGRDYVGADTCISCHEGFSWSADDVAKYLEGVHVIHSDHISAANEPDGCLECHDPIGDGPTLEGYLDPVDVPEGGLSAVTCENCHGAGGEHYGTGPIPNPTPGAEVCGQCHDTLPESHLPFHPQGDTIYAKYTSSRHATGTVRGGAECSRCHSDEGARLYKDVDTLRGVELLVMPVEDASAIQCRTCHDPHSPFDLLEDEVESRRVVIASAQYATCVNCHMSPNADPANLDPDTTELLHHEDDYERLITDSHYDNPETLEVVEGYVLDPLNENVCLDCHDVHAVQNVSSFDDLTTINNQWASSAHGGFIGKVKGEVADYYENVLGEGGTTDQVIAIKDSGTNEELAPAWTHYPWTAEYRSSCARCHTSTGARAYMENPVDYDPLVDISYTNGAMSHISFVTNDESDEVIYNTSTRTDNLAGIQKEMLYCWACHADNSGNLRPVGAITEDYGNGAVVTYPDVNGSNVCMVCHIGREVGDVIKGDADADGVRSFINSHYLAAGGMVFAESGYEYPGENYQDVTYFEHDEIGTAALVGTGENGPCAGCHMSAESSHVFLPVEKDEEVTIIAVTATVCVTCHDGEHGPAFVTEGDPLDIAAAAEFLETEKEEYMMALELLKAALAEQGIIYASDYPYFFDGEGEDYLDWAAPYGFAGWKNTMGAAFNLNLLLHDPGGFAHNRYYAKGLIWDSIDFIDDGILNDSTDETITAYSGEVVPTYVADGALTYLGTSRPGDTSRPPLLP